MLEFWATWCGPCVDAIPHFNQLVDSVDSSKVVFLSIDDESASIIDTFVSRKKMAGWIAEDQSQKTLTAYGLNSRPFTVVIDGSGHIAFIGSPMDLKADLLMSWAERRTVSKAMIAKASLHNSSTSRPPVGDSLVVPSTPSQGNSLFSLTISSVPARKGYSSMHGPEGSWEFNGVDAKFLLSKAYALPSDRFRFLGTIKTGQFKITVSHPGLGEATFAPALQLAVSSALGVSVTKQAKVEDTLVLSTIDKEQDKLSPPASIYTPQKVSISSGHLVAVNSTVDQVAAALEEYLGLPVVNNTKIDGIFDVEIELPSKDIGTLQRVLQSTLGLGLKPARSTVVSIIVSPVDPSRRSVPQGL